MRSYLDSQTPSEGSEAIDKLSDANQHFEQVVRDARVLYVRIGGDAENLSDGRRELASLSQRCELAPENDIDHKY